MSYQKEEQPPAAAAVILSVMHLINTLQKAREYYVSARRLKLV